MSATPVAGAPEVPAERVVEPRKIPWSERVADITSRGPTYVFLVVLSLIWLVPTFGLFVSSFRTAEAHAQRGWWTALVRPGEFTLEPYLNLVQNPALVQSIWNTFLIAAPTTILVVFFASLAGYAFTWVDWRGRDVTFLAVVALLVVPLQIALIPIARLFAGLGIFGSITGVVIFHIGFGLPFAIFLMRNFFAGIPGELLEAARLDGAGELRLFSKVVLPLGIPAIASLGIFQFLWTWNDLLVALVYSRPGATSPITVEIQRQMRQFGLNFDVIAPGAFISMLVPLAVFFAFQRYFVQGLLAGSSK
jgi:alpha-glucoside transport system permease protein